MLSRIDQNRLANKAMCYSCMLPQSAAPQNDQALFNVKATSQKRAQSLSKSNNAGNKLSVHATSGNELNLLMEQINKPTTLSTGNFGSKFH